MAITSDEVNFLVYRYLQESGFAHSAFTFAYESQVVKTNVASADVPPGALISFIQKGLQYVGIEAHVNEDGTERECDEEMSLLSPHTCQIAQGASRPLKSGKRKRRDENSTDDKALMNGLRIPSDQVAVLEGHTAEVFICKWNPVANLLATSSGDSTARLWQIQGEGKPTSTVLPHSQVPNDSSNSTDAGTGEKKAGLQRDVTTIEWKGDGSLLASGSYDGQTRIWSKDGKLIQTLTKHRGPIFSLKWNNAGTLLLSGSYDKSAIVWDSATGAIKQQFNVHSAPTLDVDWKDNDSFATCSTDGTIQYCKLGLSSPVKTFRGHQDEVNSIKWNPSGSVLASCSDDATIKIWNVDSDKFVHDFRDHEKQIYAIKWSPSGPNTDNPNGSHLLASASFDATIKLWDVEAGKCLSTLTHNNSIYALAFSPDGKFVASGALNGDLNIWSIKDSKVVKTYGGNGDIFEVDWNYQGDKVAACFSDSSVCVVDFRT